MMAPDDSLLGGSTVSTSANRRVLLNNLVMDHITKFLPPNDLLHLRQTSTTWNSAFIPQLRRTHRRISLDNRKYEDEDDEDFATRSMREYTETMRTSTEIPFGRYDVKDLTGDEYSTNFDDFFSVCGQTISDLKFICNWYNQRESNMDKIRRMIFELTPNLESLYIDIGVYDNEPPLVWKETTKQEDEVRQLPNLKRLRVGCSLQGVPLAQFNRLVDDIISGADGLKKLYLTGPLVQLLALNALRNHATRLDCLKSLTMDPVTWEELQLLSELASRNQNRLHLAEFVVQVRYYQTDDGNNNHIETVRTIESLRSFLVTQSGYLRRLSVLLNGLWSKKNCDRVRVELPRMAELRTLKLGGEGAEGGVGGSFDLHFQGGTLGTAFPRLQCLDLEWNLMKGEERGDILEVNRLAHREVTDLIISGIEAPYVWSPANSGKTLKKLGKRLPLITRLEALIPSDHIPRCIWTIWPALTVLHIRYAYNQGDYSSEATVELDEWLTGIPKAKHQALEAEPAYQKICSRSVSATTATDCDNAAALEQVRTLHARWKSLPGLSDLRCLRDFTLIVEPYNSKWTCLLTDIGGYFGLTMANPRMERLCLVVQHNDLSPGCESLIRFVLEPHILIELEGEGTSSLMNQTKLLGRANYSGLDIS